MHVSLPGFELALILLFSFIDNLTRDSHCVAWRFSVESVWVAALHLLSVLALRLAFLDADLLGEHGCCVKLEVVDMQVSACPKHTGISSSLHLHTTDEVLPALGPSLWRKGSSCELWFLISFWGDCSCAWRFRQNWTCVTCNFLMHALIPLSTSSQVSYTSTPSRSSLGKGMSDIPGCPASLPLLPVLALPVFYFLFVEILSPATLHLAKYLGSTRIDTITHQPSCHHCRVVNL